MLKKILFYNRRFVRRVMELLFPMTCVMFGVFGACIIVGELPSFDSVDLSRYPQWIGYLFIWGGMLSLIGFTIDVLVFPILSAIFKKKKPRQSLLDKIKMAEEGK